jgi:transposase
MVRRGEITDPAWQEIEPLLPENGRSGGQWRDYRTLVNGTLLWKLRTGSPRRDLPDRYGPWQTSCFDRFNCWRRNGTWDHLLAHARTKKNDAVGEVEWEVSVDGTRWSGPTRTPRVPGVNRARPT